MSGDAKGKDIATKRLRKASKTPNPPRKRVRRLLCWNRLKVYHCVPLNQRELELVKQLQGHEGKVLEKKGLVMQVL